MKVVRIAQSSLQNEEWFNFYTECIDLIDHFDAETLGIEPLYDRFYPLLNTADKLLETLRKSSYTEDLEEADRKRDELFSALYNVVKISQKQPDLAKSKAAHHLYNLLRGYRNHILHASYVNESSSIYNLLQDVKGEYAADVALLGVTEWVAALKSAEDNFLAVNAVRQHESVNKHKGDLVKLRREADTLYNAMVSNLDGQLLAAGLGGDVEVDPISLDDDVHQAGDVFAPETHGNIPYNFVVDWNETVKKYRNLIVQRAGRRHASDQKPDVDGPDDLPIEEED
jgi:hypothetical protein